MESKDQINQLTYLLTQDQLYDLLSKHPLNLVTQEQLSDLLSVHPTTLINWHKSGLIPKYQLGRRVYYKPSDIENAMIKLKVELS